MSIESDILTTLNNHAGLTPLVGSRNYAVNLPQKPIYPSIVFLRISTNPSNNLSGRNALTNARFQFDIRDKKYESARLVEIEFINAMESSNLFKSIYLTENDIQKESATETYRISIDFSLWFYKT